MPEYDIYIGSAPIDIYILAAQASTGGAAAFTDLSDKATANIPAINDPLATALGVLSSAITFLGTSKAPLASPTFTGTVTIPSGASISGYLTSATAASTYAPIIHTHGNLVAIGTGAGIYEALQLESNGATEIQSIIVDPGNLNFGIARVAANSLNGDRTWNEPDASGVRALTSRADGKVTQADTHDLTTSSSPSFTKVTASSFVEGVTDLGPVVSSATIVISTGSVVTAKLTASTACTFTLPTAAAGLSFILHLKQASTTGNGTAAFSGVVWSGGTAPTITATAGKMDIISFVAGPDAAGSGYTWYGSALQNVTPP